MQYCSRELDFAAFGNLNPSETLYKYKYLVDHISMMSKYLLIVNQISFIAKQIKNLKIVASTT